MLTNIRAHWVFLARLLEEFDAAVQCSNVINEPVRTNKIFEGLNISAVIKVQTRKGAQD